MSKGADIVHSVLEGLDSSQSKGGLIIRKKPTADSNGDENGFKMPSGGSLLGLDKLAAAKERERRLKDAENAKKRQLEEETDNKGSEKFFRKEETKERTFREPRIETPSYTGGVSEEARKREEERRRRDDRGIRVENKRDRDDDYKRDRDNYPKRDRDHRDRNRDRDRYDKRDRDRHRERGRATDW